MRWLDRTHIEDLALGAAVLGAGGGGDPYLGKLMALAAIERNGPVCLLDLDELEEDDLIVPTAMMGAPTVIVEKLPRGDELLHAFRTLERILGRPVRATMPIEAGGLNSTIPLSVAATLRVPVVDCDGMGRAFPEIQMVTLTMYGISATPMAMADEKGNAALLQTIDNRWTERFARSITVDMGGTAHIALYAATAGQLREAAIPGTLTLAERIGHAIRTARMAHQDPVQAVQELTGGIVLFHGKIVDVQRYTISGFARGEATIAGIGIDQGTQMVVQFQNENLVAIREGEIVASVPDLIVLLDAEMGSPVTTEALRYGYRVVVLGIPCHPKWRTPSGLSLVGPRYFGYDVDYVPVEQRAHRGGSYGS